MQAKLCLLGIYHESWHWTKVVPIVKPGILCYRACIDQYVCLLVAGNSWRKCYVRVWAEKNGILSPTQYGFRKRKCKQDCLAMLTTNISRSFEMKKQTVAAFLDISGACDNVLIDVLCGVMLEKKLPLGIFRFMWSLLWCKTLVFCVGGAECMTLTGYKGLPQGSVLSLFL
jgi:hypothetical protein